MKHKYSARRIEAVRTIPRASLTIAHLDSLLPGPAVIFCRVSDRKQESHLKYQQDRLTPELERRGFIVPRIFKEVGSGSGEVRVTLERAALYAKKFKAILVAVSPDRFLRGYRWKKVKKGQKRDMPPGVVDFDRLKLLTYGVKLATLLHPDSKEVRSDQTKQGIAARSKPGELKQRKIDLLPEVLKRRKAGQTYRAIGEDLNVHWTIIWKWINRV